jgi:hypothetical protein
MNYYSLYLRNAFTYADSTTAEDFIRLAYPGDNEAKKRRFTEALTGQDIDTLREMRLVVNHVSGLKRMQALPEMLQMNLEAIFSKDEIRAQENKHD